MKLFFDASHHHQFIAVKILKKMNLINISKEHQIIGNIYMGLDDFFLSQLVNF